MAARAADIEIAEPTPDDCSSHSLPPEGNVKHRNYRMLNENLRAYTPTGDIHTSPEKGKLVSKFDVSTTISPNRARILELLRPDDPGRDSLEAIVKPVPRRGLTRPFDEDTRRFLQRALLSPSPYSGAPTPEPCSKTPAVSPEPTIEHKERKPLKGQRSLADELREAEEDELSGESESRKDIYLEFIKRGGGVKEAVERERLGKLALSVEDDSESDEDSLSLAARRLDALLIESRGLHEELRGIHEDMQAQCVRAGRCAAAARALDEECRSLRFLDDVLALLKGDVRAAHAREWPFALPARTPGRNYIV